MEKMLAVVFHGVDEGYRIEKVDAPSIKGDYDVLIEVKLAGICGTDPAILEGRHPASPPVILGHEYTGEVVDVGDKVKNVEVGDHVVVDPNIKCGKCYYCRRGKENLCENMTTLGIFIDGGFTRYNVAPESAVYKIRDDMRWRDAVLVEPVSCAVNGVMRANVKVGDAVAIIGAGPMGLIWTQLVKHRGAGPIIVSDLVEKRLKMAKKLGADIVVNPKEEDFIEAVKNATDGRMADVCVEVVGSPVTVEQAIRATGYGGRTVIFGTTKKGLKVSIEPYSVMRYEREIIGSYIANHTFIPAIAAMYERIVNSDMLITHEFPLDQFGEALKAHKSGEAIKIVLKP